MTSLPAGQGTSIVVASIGGVASLFGLYLSRRADRQRELEAALRTRKAEVYEEFAHFWLGALLSIKEGEVTTSNDEMKQFFGTFTQKFIVWASDEVIQANREFRREAMKPTSGPGSLLEFEKTLFAIRKDLGHTNKLKTGDLLALWINDIDEALAKA